jgi:hypothetical protein
MDEENKFEKCGAFFERNFNAVFSPRSPHIPPRFHHPKATILHHYLAKTPAKTHLHHARKKHCIERHFLHPTSHAVVHPTPGKAASLLQPTDALCHRWDRCRLYRVVSGLPTKSKWHNASQQRTHDPAVINKSQ